MVRRPDDVLLLLTGSLPAFSGLISVAPDLTPFHQHSRRVHLLNEVSISTSAGQAVAKVHDAGSTPARSPLSDFLRRPMNWLLLFIPITVALEHLAHVSAPVLFFMAALSIVPIAAQIVAGTEQIAVRTGDAVGGLLNATFGNAPELIIALVALKAGYFEMVRASLVGAILANLLLALGVGFVTGGIRVHEQRFNSMAARTYSTMMFLAAVSLTVPSAFSRVLAPNSIIRAEAQLNFGIAILLLIAYALYILYSLKTHSSLFKSVELGLIGLIRPLGPIRLIRPMKRNLLFIYDLSDLA